MRPRFEKDLSSFNVLAKEESAGFDAPEDIEKFGQVLDWYLNQAAEKQGTSVEDQRRIYELQKQKQEIMFRLKEWLSCLDDANCDIEKEPGSRNAYYDAKKKVFIYDVQDNPEKEATFGEIMTDIDWGVLYALDKKTLPRNLFKQYLLQRTKNDLRQLLNKQIIISETRGSAARSKRREAYISYQEGLESGSRYEHGGCIAEDMVKNILRKFAYDSDVDFEIIETDIFQDIEQKIDFIIHFINKNRGVKVFDEDKLKDIGVQFTTNMSDETLKHKEFQVGEAKKHITPEWHIDDLVLVVFPLKISNNLFRKWIESGRSAGGPDKYMNRRDAEKLFQSLMQNMISQDKIKDYWLQFKDYFSEKYKKT